MGFWYGRKIRDISKKLDFSSILCYLLGSIACMQKSYLLLAFIQSSVHDTLMEYFL